MNLNIGIIDYEMGNICSINNAFNRIDQKINLVNTPKELKKYDALILPGVGSFDPAMRNLNSKGLSSEIKSLAKKGKPILGICLGLQLLFERSEEGMNLGLNIFEGKVKALPINQNERIPNMGWSKLIYKKICPLVNNINQSDWAYFVHSYYALPIKQDLSSSTLFGEIEITASVWKDNIVACQFHPEKSGLTGQKMLLNWLEWLKRI